MEQILFTLYAVFACGGALAVVLSQNIVRMAFYLVVSLGSTAALFFLLGADFVGATQLLIYVGGTVVLLIFGVMLTSSSPIASLKNTPAELLQGGAVGLAFLTLVISTVLAVDWPVTQKKLSKSTGVHASAFPSEGFNDPQEGNTARSIGSALLGVRFDQDLIRNVPVSTAPAGVVEHNPDSAHPRQPDIKPEDAQDQPAAGPTKLSTGYLLPFEIISVHLLVVLIGASYLARAKRTNPASAG